MYKLIYQSNSILRLSDRAVIPNDPMNMDYQDYLSWLLQGNTPEDADIPYSVPNLVTMRQARIALLRKGKLNDVEACIQSMTGTEGDEARIEWEYSSLVDRNRPLMQKVIDLIGLTNTEVDELFTLAYSIP